MNAVQTMPSPISPYDQQYKQSYAARQCFPPSPVTDTMSPQQSAPNRGLGLYACSMPGPVQSTVSPIITASPQSESWSQEYPTSQPPDIFSAAFDPFSGFSSSSNTGMVGSHSPEAPGLEFCQTPPSSNVQSHRGSVSSYAQSDVSDAYTPRVKPEDGGEWYQSANDHVLQRGISQAPMVYTHGPATLASQTEDLYRTQPTEWNKNDTTGYITELQATSDGRLPRFDMQSVLPSASRIKKKRQRTTPEEATHECKVCGKLFKRSYNWKSHMETHNPERKYPHVCTAMIGETQCTKKFQRKTDLDRHHDSVHLKARNHKCNLCGNRFARRDTLRRHTEDGCPKRFELGIRDAAAAAASQQQPRWFPTPAYPSDARPRSFSVGMPHTTPMTPMSVAPSSATPASAYPMFSGAPGPMSSPAYHS